MNTIKITSKNAKSRASFLTALKRVRHIVMKKGRQFKVAHPSAVQPLMVDGWSAVK